MTTKRLFQTEKNLLFMFSCPQNYFTALLFAKFSKKAILFSYFIAHEVIFHWSSDTRDKYFVSSFLTAIAFCVKFRQTPRNYVRYILACGFFSYTFLRYLLFSRYIGYLYRITLKPIITDGLFSEVLGKNIVFRYAICLWINK